MVKLTQTICQLLLTNCLSMFDHFVVLVLKELNTYTKYMHPGQSRDIWYTPHLIYYLSVNPKQEKFWCVIILRYNWNITRNEEIQIKKWTHKLCVGVMRLDTEKENYKKKLLLRNGNGFHFHQIYPNADNPVIK